jgi:hypothetical protein
MLFLKNPSFKMMMRVLFWAALIFALTMAFLPKPPQLGIERMGDKFAHMLAFATLSGLAALGFSSKMRWRMAERLSFLGAMVEVVQAIPALQRTCDIRDWMADTGSILVVMILASLILPRLCPGFDDEPEPDLA